MKLLLTSAGITNKSIENCLRKLAKGNLKIAFIPTAASGEEGDKSWLEEDFDSCRKLGNLEIVDISVLEKDKWLPKLEWANVIFVGGGDTTYLMNWIRKSGLDKELSELLKTRVYVGISAGSMVLSKTIQTSSEYLFSLYGDEVKNAPSGLGFIDFDIRPHLNSNYFPKVNRKNMDKLFGNTHSEVYVLDDESAVLLEGGNTEVISEGEWIKYSKKD